MEDAANEIERLELQWGRGFAATEGEGTDFERLLVERFNGAVASQPRKDRVPKKSRCRLEWLQWGRGFAATEGSCTRRPVRQNVLLQWGRGFAATEGLHRVVVVPPAAQLQWGRGFAATEGQPRNDPRPS